MKIVGRYELGEPIGHGGMAVVYLARQIDLDRLVALKELRVIGAPHDPDQTERFLREAKMAGALSHPNIVSVIEHFEHDGTPYIAMEYLERGSLRPWIGRMTLAQIAGVLEGLLTALEHAAHYGIVHRDLKPENVLITAQGQVKIADFGIAKARTMNKGTLTVAGSTVGTPTYMAPEQAMAQELGAYTDLYSIGVMAYEMFVGRVPFDDANPFAVAMRHVHDEIPPAHSVRPNVDPALSDWIDRLLVKDPASRTQSAEVAWDELETFIAGQLGSVWRREARLLSPSGPAAPLPRAPVPIDEDPRDRQHDPADGYEEFDFDKPVRVVPTPPPKIPPTPRPGRSGQPPGVDPQFLPPPRVPSESGYLTYEGLAASTAPEQLSKPDLAVVTPPPAVREPTPAPESAAQPPAVTPNPFEVPEALIAEPIPADPVPAEPVADELVAAAAAPAELDEAPAPAPVADPLPDAPEAEPVAAGSDVDALTVKPDVVPVPASRTRPEPAREAPRTAPAQRASADQIRRRRLALIGGGAAAVVAVVGAVALSGGGGSGATTTKPTVAKAPTLQLETPDLILSLPTTWRQRPEFPHVPGLNAESAKAAELKTNSAFVAAQMVLGEADPTLLPSGLLGKVDRKKLPHPETVTLGGRQTLVYDGLDVDGVRATLRVYATLTEDGVATVVCASPATPAECDTVAKSLQLTSARAMPIGATPEYQATLRSTSATLDGRLKTLNGDIDDAKTAKGKAKLTRAVARAYTSAVASLGGGSEKGAREKAQALNLVDGGLNRRLVGALRNAADAYSGMSGALKRSDAAANKRWARAARKAIARIEALRPGFSTAGYAGDGPSVTPRSRIKVARKKVVVSAGPGPTTITPPAGTTQTPPPANTPPPAFTPPPAATPPAATPPPPPASKPKVIIEE